MIYRYIYKITCTKGKFKDKFYFGQHTTTNLDDGYKGSGTKIKKYYKKYPDDYIKEIIAFYNTEDELNKAEYDIIISWLNNPMCLNLKEGGGNNKLSEESKKKLSESCKGRIMSEETKKKISIANKNNKAFLNHHHTEETKKKISDNLKGIYFTDEHKSKISMSLKEREFSEEHKKKLSEVHTGKLNGMYGKEGWMKGKKHTEEFKRKVGEKISNKRWINNGTVEKYVNSEDVEHYLNNNWKKGRIYHKRVKEE